MAHSVGGWLRRNFWSESDAHREQQEQSAAHNDRNRAERGNSSAGIGQAMIHGVWGKFKRALSDLLSARAENFQLPNIVVIGQETSGKSSVLENITKCAIFPRDRGACTKRPIRVRLIPPEALESVDSLSPIKITVESETFTSVEAAREKIWLHMAQYSGVSISADELQVTVKSPDVPELELVDTPGIREYPPEARDTSKTVASQYVNEADSVVLCVIPATSTRLTSNQALGMVKDAGKQPSSIVALTMIDQVHDDDVHDFVISRVKQQNDEAIESFSACIALANRRNNHHFTLAQAHELDMDMARHIQSFASSNVSGFLGVQSLINAVMSLFYSVMHSTWKPKALSDLQAQKKELHKKLQDLGEPPEDVHGQQLAELICAAVAIFAHGERNHHSLSFWNQILNTISDNNASNMLVTTESGILQHAKTYCKAVCARKNLDQIKQLVLQYIASLPFVLIDGIFVIDSFGHYATVPGSYESRPRGSVLEELDDSFQLDPSILTTGNIGNHHNYTERGLPVLKAPKRAERFYTCAKQCANTAYKQVLEMDRCAKIVVRRIDQHDCSSSNNGHLDTLNNAVCNALMDDDPCSQIEALLLDLVNAVYNDKENSAILGGNFAFSTAECEAFSRERYELHQKIERVRYVKQRIENL